VATLTEGMVRSGQPGEKHFQSELSSVIADRSGETAKISHRASGGFGGEGP